jgi:hypothetical protein
MDYKTLPVSAGKGKFPIPKEINLKVTIIIFGTGLFLLNLVKSFVTLTLIEQAIVAIVGLFVGLYLNSFVDAPSNDEEKSYGS